MFEKTLRNRLTPLTGHLHAVRVFMLLSTVLLIAGTATLQPLNVHAQAQFYALNGSVKRSSDLVQLQGGAAFPWDAAGPIFSLTASTTTWRKTEIEFKIQGELTGENLQGTLTFNLDPLMLTDPGVYPEAKFVGTRRPDSASNCVGKSVICGTWDISFSYSNEGMAYSTVRDLNFVGVMDLTQKSDQVSGTLRYSIPPEMVEWINGWGGGGGSNNQGVLYKNMLDKQSLVVSGTVEMGAATSTPSSSATETPEPVNSEQAGTLEATGPACNPNVSGLDPQKPGDVISPGATYLASDGTEVGVVQDRWYINGQETNSAVWDGNQTTVELQWTCLDHKGYSRTYTIPAYQLAQTPAQSGGQAPETPAGPNSGGLLTGLGMLLAGLGGLVGLGSAVGLGIPIIKAVTTGVPPAATVTPPTRLPAQPPAQSPPVPQNAPMKTPGKLDSSLKKHWDLKLNDLVDQRTKIQLKIQATNQSIDKLTRSYKNNILKVIMKGGLETGQILFDAVSGGAGEIPNLGLEIGKKYVTDKITDKVFEKHETSQDGQNVVSLKDLIDKLKNQRDGLRNQVRDINHEIKGIQEHLRENF